MAESKRHLILQQLVDRFKDIEKAVGTDPMIFDYSTVELGPLLDGDARKRTAIGIVPGTEVNDVRFFPIMECKLPVTIEWRITVQAKEKPGVMAEVMLAEVQRVIAMDRTMNGFAIDVKETGNEIDVLSYADKTVNGIVQLLIIYRHDLDEVRTLMGS